MFELPVSILTHFGHTNVNLDSFKISGILHVSWRLLEKSWKLLGGAWCATRRILKALVTGVLDSLQKAGYKDL